MTDPSKYKFNHSMLRIKDPKASLKFYEHLGMKVVEQKKLAKELDAVRIQLLSDLCDVAIPAAALGWVNLDDGIVGLAGTTSSLLGVWSQWKKTA